MFDAVIFDFDGLILDTESSSVEAWSEIYREFDLEFPVDRWLENVGSMDTFDALAYLESHLDRPVNREEVYQSVRQRDQEIIAQRGPMAGVLDRLAEAKTLGLKMAIASSSPARWLNYHLPRLGLMFEFDAVRTSTDVDNRTKPDPAVYLAACAAVKVDPSRAVALEDSLHGVIAAQEAGMKAVAVPNAVTKQLDFSQADLILNSLEEMTIADILEKLSEKS
ncbi:MAG: HAD-IA family hydrolase [Ardenticatenaceae bacterium]|nr:HAD-IA family hydrolase [Ardenticatenaceae bacterium]